MIASGFCWRSIWQRRRVTEQRHLRVQRGLGSLQRDNTAIVATGHRPVSQLRAVLRAATQGEREGERGVC